MQLGNSAALGGGGLEVNAGVLDLNGHGIGVPTLSGIAGMITDNSSSSSTATLLTVTNSGTFSGTLSDGGDHQHLALAMTGSGP